MASIAISDLPFAGSAFFSDSESYLNELSDRELEEIQGGRMTNFRGIVITGVPISIIWA